MTARTGNENRISMTNSSTVQVMETMIWRLEKDKASREKRARQGQPEQDHQTGEDYPSLNASHYPSQYSPPLSWSLHLSVIVR
jgi:hypothetical protein